MKLLIPILILLSSCQKSINMQVTFSGKVFLQGAYLNGTMHDQLNQKGLIPISSPYGLAPATATSSIAGHQIVDWVLIEIRSEPVAYVSALVTTDGTLIDCEGNTSITFDVPEGSYYIAIHHRNHLGIRSADLVDFTSGSASFDFTTQDAFVNPDYPHTSQVNIGTLWAMRGCDANGDGYVKRNGPGNDENYIRNIKLGGSNSTVLVNQYDTADINMDGVIKANGPGNDLNFMWNVCGIGLGVVYKAQL